MQIEFFNHPEGTYDVRMLSMVRSDFHLSL